MKSKFERIEFDLRSLRALLDQRGLLYSSLNNADQDKFEKVVPINELTAYALSFINEGSDSSLRILKEAKGGVVLVDKKWGEDNKTALRETAACIILVDRPKTVFAQILELLNIETELKYSGIHTSAIVDPRAIIHPTASIGPYCIIGACEIGEYSIIGSYSIINHRVQIGSRVIIHENCMIGGHSPGFSRCDDGSWIRLPQIGWTIIEDDVQIYPFSKVDRGTLAETRVQKGAVICDYVYVSHNVRVGMNAVITPSVVLCGRSVVGEGAWIGVGSVIKQRVCIGKDAVVGLGAVVIRDVPEGVVVAGVPASILEKSK